MLALGEFLLLQKHNGEQPILQFKLANQKQLHPGLWEDQTAKWRSSQARNRRKGEALGSVHGWGCSDGTRGDLGKLEGQVLEGCNEGPEEALCRLEGDKEDPVKGDKV